MPLRPSTFGLLTAALLAPLATARAADLDENYGYAEAPQDVPAAVIPQTKVEFGTGWYVRGDIAATETYAAETARASLDTEEFGIRKNHSAAYDLSLGGGYSFTNGFRSDLNVDFHQPTSSDQLDILCSSSAVLTCSQHNKFTGYDALANLFYDFGTWYRLTPYIGAGAGVAFGDANTRIDGDPSGNTYFGKYAYHNFAFALMAGVAIDILPHTKLDFGYRYLNNGNLVGTSIYYHEVRAGLRYMIDN